MKSTKLILILTSLILMTSISLSVAMTASERWTIRAKYFDKEPGDGTNDEGSWDNPLMINDSDGNLVAIIRRRFDKPDNRTYTNPYIIHWQVIPE